MLTNKRRAFVEAYLHCWNATKAAQSVGYAHPGATASALLRTECVREAIRQRLRVMAMSADEVLYRLTEQARGVATQYIRDDGTIDLTAMIADGRGHLVKSVSWDRQGNIIVGFYDAQLALVQIGKHFKLFTERAEITGEGGGPVRVVAIGGIDPDKDI